MHCGCLLEVCAISTALKKVASQHSRSSGTGTGAGLLPVTEMSYLMAMDVEKEIAELKRRVDLHETRFSQV